MDTRFSLDRLTEMNRIGPMRRKLDVARAGIIGVSLGGVIASKTCQLDRRYRACVMLDAFVPDDVVRTGLPQDALWITRDAGTMVAEGWAQRDIDQHQQSMRSTAAHMNGRRNILFIPGKFHANFSDFPLLTIPFAARAAGIIGPIDPGYGGHLVEDATLTFLWRTLSKPAAAPTSH